MIVSFRDRNTDTVDSTALFGLNIVKLSFSKERRMRIELMEHALYRVLAKTLEVNFACIALLDFGERFFKVIRQLFGQVDLRIIQMKRGRKSCLAGPGSWRFNLLCSVNGRRLCFLNIVEHHSLAVAKVVVWHLPTGAVWLRAQRRI